LVFERIICQTYIKEDIINSFTLLGSVIVGIISSIEETAIYDFILTGLKNIF